MMAEPNSDDDISVQSTEHATTAAQETSAKLLVIGFPSRSEFGIDFSEWETGPRFRGLQGIPPGLHFVYYSTRSALPQSVRETPGQSTGPVFRMGFFHWFEPNEILVCEWDKSTEQLLMPPALDPAQVERYKYNIREFVPHLGPYPTSERRTRWRRLTRYITPELLSRLLPRSGINRAHILSAMTESHLSDAEMQRAMQRAHRETGAAALSDPAPNTGNARLNFTRFDLKRSVDPATMSAAQVSKYAVDKSWLLESVMRQPGSNLLGELQFAFVCLVAGQNFEGFEQWKRLMHLVCQSAEALEKRPQFFIDFIDVVMDHLAECPSDFFVDILSENNFVQVLLSELYTNITEISTHPDLVAAARTLHDHVMDRFGMPLVDPYADDQLSDDDRPQVVEGV